MACLKAKAMVKTNECLFFPVLILPVLPPGVPILLDLAFACNVRYMDDQEMYLSNVELYKTLPYARYSPIHSPSSILPSYSWVTKALLLLHLFVLLLLLLLPPAG